MDPGMANWTEHPDGSKSAKFPAFVSKEAPPFVSKVDPMEAECARVLGFATGDGPDYCASAAREFLALWRHMERQDIETDAAMERARIVSLIRDRQDYIMRGKVGDGFALIRLNELVGILDSIQSGPRGE